MFIKTNIMSNSINFTHRERSVHMSWCLKNDIIIYFQATDFYSGRIVIEEKGKKYIKAEEYKQQTKKRKLKTKDKKWWVEIMKLYTSKFLEYNKQQ